MTDSVAESIPTTAIEKILHRNYLVDVTQYNHSLGPLRVKGKILSLAPSPSQRNYIAILLDGTLEDVQK